MIDSIRNIHEGKRIWIFGSGPSLLTVNETKIPKDDIIICCNSSTYHFKKRMDYAVFTDETANYSRWYLNLYKRKKTKIILLNRGIKKVSENTIYIEKDFLQWKMTKDADKIIGGYDVIHCAVHVAYIMGAKEIILGGVDLKHVSSTQKHANSQELTKDAPELITQSVSESTQANDTLFDGHLGQSLGGWNIIKTHNNLPIRSIGVNGNLTHYPIISFNDLINELS